MVLRLVTLNTHGPSVPHSSLKDASLQFLFSSFSRQGLIYIAQDDLEFTVWPPAGLQLMILLPQSPEC